MVYQNLEVIFELKGVHIIEMLCESAEIPNYQQTITHETSCNTHAATMNRKIPLKCRGAISFYCICFSGHYQILWVLECTNSRGNY